MAILAVYNSAPLSDLAGGSRLHLDSAHLLHGQSKLFKELGERATEELVDDGEGGAVRGESRVRLEEAAPLGQEGVVAEVEGPEAAWIHLDNGGVVSRSSALSLPQICCIFTVQRWVLVTSPSEVVEPVAKGGAVRNPNCVSSCDQDIV